MKRLFIPHVLPGLNEILDARKRKLVGAGRGGDMYNLMKSRWATVIKGLAHQQGFDVQEGGYFTYLFLEPNRRRDPSNIVAGGVKLIEDALQEAGLLGGDGWKHVLGIAPYWVRTETMTCGVYVWVGDGCLSEQAAFCDAFNIDQEKKQDARDRS
jgi:hypothetical protein